MADMLQNRMSILEQVQRIDPQGNAAKIVEVLAKTNPIFTEAAAQMCNDTRSHVSAIRQNLGTISPRLINQGADFYKSDVKNVRDEVLLLESRVRIDEQIVESSPSPDTLRMQEMIAAYESLTNQWASYFFYGVGSGPGKMNGLATRFNTLSMANVWDGGGTTDGALNSMFFLEWKMDQCSTIYPKNSSAGIEEEDKGKHTVYDGNGRPYEAYENIIKLQLGASIPDPRAVQRVGNLESSGTTNNLADEATWNILIDAISELPNMGTGAVGYVNRQQYAAIQKMAFNKTNAAFSYMEVSGQIVLTCFGIPVRVMEAIRNDESLLV